MITAFVCFSWTQKLHRSTVCVDGGKIGDCNSRQTFWLDFGHKYGWPWSLRTAYSTTARQIPHQVFQTSRWVSSLNFWPKWLPMNQSIRMDWPAFTSVRNLWSFQNLKILLFISTLKYRSWKNDLSAYQIKCNNHINYQV